MRLFIFLLGTILLLTNCEEQPVIIPSAGGGNTNTSDTIFKTVLLEDLTGVRCPNCPNGTAKIEDMLAIYGKENLIPIAIHGTFLTAPLTESKYDLRSNYSRAIEASYAGQFRGKPAAAVNRFRFDGAEFLADDEVENWPLLVAEELSKPADVTLSMDVTYDESSRRLDVDVTVTGINDITEPININVLFTQNAIIDKQESAGEVIPEYEHNHVLFEGFTDALGDILSETGIAAGETIEVSYTRVLPTEPVPFYNAEEMDIVAFVSLTNQRTILYTIYEHVID